MLVLRLISPGKLFQKLTPRELTMFAILRFKKLKGAAVGGSDRHTERAQETPNADEKRTATNMYLRGEPGLNLREKVDAVIEKAGGKPRKDSVECVEYLMTASPEFFRDAESGNIIFDKEAAFYRKAKEFIEEHERRGIVFVKAVAHRDELTPHIVAYGVPLDQNGKLNCKYHFGGSKWRLSEYQDEYAETMEPLGLTRGVERSPAKHQTMSEMYDRLKEVDRLTEELEQMKRMQEQSRRMLEQNTILLDEQRLKRADAPLAEIIKAFVVPDRLLETSQGLAVLNQNDSSKFTAIITPDNKVFDQTGAKLSDGSSVMMLSQITGASTDKVLSAIERKFDSETRERAARAFGDELAKSKSDAKERDFSRAETEVEAAHEQQQIAEDYQISEGRVMS